jgi:hypothetical protein
MTKRRLKSTDTPFSKRLVIDASVTRRYGDTASTDAQLCRHFLMVVLELCHRVVVTPGLKAEFMHRHSTQFYTWLRKMRQSGKVEERNPAKDETLRSSIRSLAAPVARKKAMTKDVHLLEAALLTDENVVSADDAARSAFSLLCRNVPGLRRIVWVNPLHVNEDPVRWLRRGARPEQERRLCAGGP